jgi:hypothetical protein
MRSIRVRLSTAAMVAEIAGRCSRAPGYAAGMCATCVAQGAVYVGSDTGYTITQKPARASTEVRVLGP